MALNSTELTFVRKVGRTAKMYYISIPYGLGKELYKKPVIVKIIPIPEDKDSPR